MIRTEIPVPMTRRHFLASSVFLFARNDAVRIHLVGAHPGATMAVEEMSRTASLLGRRIETASHVGAIEVDLRQQSLTWQGERYVVAASPQARQTALAAWRGPRADAAVEWHPGLTRYGAEQLNARFLERFDQPMDAAAWISWMLVKIAADAQLRGVGIASGRFDGHKGTPLAFGDDRHLVQPLCLVDAAGTLLGVTE
jgi:hypothetical protein